MSKTILVVEDEKTIADILVFNLQREGYQTLEANDGAEGLKLATEKNPDLILLDVMLPVMDGFEVCKNIRRKSQVPILMLTAREEETDKVLGLELGADDYITKPFSMRELMARVKTNIRRGSIQPEDEIKCETSSSIQIKQSNGSVYKNGKQIDLSVREFELLTFMSATPGQVYSREELMEKVWGYEYYGDLRAVDVAIRRLREKIEDESAQPKYIITKRGLGYYFSETEKIENI